MTLRIEIGTEVLPEAFRWDPAKPLTGTTRFYVRVAEAFARLGHIVTVRYQGADQRLNGVWYSPIEEGMREPDFVLDCNCAPVRPEQHRGTRRAQWTSFFGRPDLCNGAGYEKLFLVSSYVESTFAHFAHCPTSVIELGNEHPVVAEPDLRARPKTCCYTSSPDRGGNFLKGIWGEVEAATGYTLECSPYGTDFSDEAMQALYRRSRFWVYPAIGTDSIISTLEAQAAGCIPFVVPHMGLPETLRYGERTDLFRFKKDLIETLLDFDSTVDGWMQERDLTLRARPIPTWDDVARRILEEMKL